MLRFSLPKMPSRTNSTTFRGSIQAAVGNQ
jgi:hypothetical protein